MLVTVKHLLTMLTYSPADAARSGWAITISCPLKQPQQTLHADTLCAAGHATDTLKVTEYAVFMLPASIFYKGVQNVHFIAILLKSDPGNFKFTEPNKPD